MNLQGGSLAAGEVLAAILHPIFFAEQKGLAPLGEQRMEFNGLRMDRFLTVGALGHSVAGSEFELQSSSKRWARNNRPSPGGCLLMGKILFRRAPAIRNGCGLF